MKTSEKLFTIYFSVHDSNRFKYFLGDIFIVDKQYRAIFAYWNSDCIFCSYIFNHSKLLLPKAKVIICFATKVKCFIALSCPIVYAFVPYILFRSWDWEAGIYFMLLEGISGTLIIVFTIINVVYWQYKN